MYAILMAILKTMFSKKICPQTGEPCPWPELCELLGEDAKRGCKS